MTVPTYKLTLHKSYYDKGFFNLGVDIEKFVAKDNGEIVILLGSQKQQLPGRITRDANLNGTPRISGGVELRDWFHKNFDLNDVVDVAVLNPDQLWIVGRSS